MFRYILTSSSETTKVEEKSAIYFAVFSFPSLKEFFISSLGIKSSTGHAVPSKEVAGDSKTL